MFPTVFRVFSLRFYLSRIQQYIRQNVGTLCYTEYRIFHFLPISFLFSCKLHALCLNYKSTQFKGLIMFPKDKGTQFVRFREKYIEKSKRYNIRENIVRWHVKHAEHVYQSA